MQHPFILGLVVAAVAIDAAEILFNYGLGDKTKDLFNFLKGLFVKVEKDASKVDSAAKAAVSDVKKV